MLKRLIGAALAIVLSSPALADHVPGHNKVRIGLKEYSTGYLPRQKDSTGVRFYAPSEDVIVGLPDAYDSRVEGLVTSIKDQGQCGSCWAFARARALETALIKAGHPLTVNLAEQDTLVNDRTAYGCDGGFMDGRFETTFGVAAESSCPYRASDSVACNGVKYAKATKWAMIGADSRAPSVEELKAAVVQYGTIFVTVAAGSGFNPVAGVIATCGSRGINHMVTLQGYRTTALGKTQFLIGNSWGTSWGQGGYAWSEAGCNQLASSPGDAAGFFYVEGEAPTPTPVPAKLDLPIEVVVYAGKETAIQVRPQPNVKYKWSTGVTGARIYVTPTASTELTLTATDADGATSQKVKVTVK